jgi:hypothetical protein
MELRERMPLASRSAEARSLPANAAATGSAGPLSTREVKRSMAVNHSAWHGGAETVGDSLERQEAPECWLSEP